MSIIDGYELDELRDKANERDKFAAALKEIIELEHYPDATIARKALGIPVTDRKD